MGGKGGKLKFFFFFFSLLSSFLRKMQNTAHLGQGQNHNNESLYNTSMHHKCRVLFQAFALYLRNRGNGFRTVCARAAQK